MFLVCVLKSSGNICASDNTDLQYSAFHCGSPKCFAKLIRAITTADRKFWIK